MSGDLSKKGCKAGFLAQYSIFEDFGYLKKGGSRGYEPPWGERHLDIQEALHRGIETYNATMWYVKSFF